jgi:hypothetical protein
VESAKWYMHRCPRSGDSDGGAFYVGDTGVHLTSLPEKWEASFCGGDFAFAIEIGLAAGDPSGGGFAF